MKWQQCVGAARVMMCRFRKSRGGGGEWRERTRHLSSSIWEEVLGRGVGRIPELKMRPCRVALIQGIQAQLFCTVVFFLLLMSSVPNPMAATSTCGTAAEIQQILVNGGQELYGWILFWLNYNRESICIYCMHVWWWVDGEDEGKRRVTGWGLERLRF